MTILFKAKTQNAYSIKILGELLTNIIKTACFEIDHTGVRLRMMDYHRKILVDVELKAENFISYRFRAPKKLYIGINLNHFHKMLKSIKKKDSLHLQISTDRPNDLTIHVKPKENNRVTTSYIKIQNIQNIDIDVPPITRRPILVSSSEYSKLCKDLSEIGTNIRITSKNFRIQFECNGQDIFGKAVDLGDIDSDSEGEEELSDDASNISEDSETYSQEFDIEQLCRITRLSGLAPNLQIYPGNPFLFSCAVGTLGTIKIYIKSKQQVEEENEDNLDYDST